MLLQAILPSLASLALCLPDRFYQGKAEAGYWTLGGEWAGVFISLAPSLSSCYRLAALSLDVKAVQLPLYAQFSLGSSNCLSLHLFRPGCPPGLHYCPRPLYSTQSGAEDPLLNTPQYLVWLCQMFALRPCPSTAYSAPPFGLLFRSAVSIQDIFTQGNNISKQFKSNTSWPYIGTIKTSPPKTVYLSQFSYLHPV